MQTKILLFSALHIQALFLFTKKRGRGIPHFTSNPPNPSNQTSKSSSTYFPYSYVDNVQNLFNVLIPLGQIEYGPQFYEIMPNRKKEREKGKKERKEKFIVECLGKAGKRRTGNYCTVTGTTRYNFSMHIFQTWRLQQPWNSLEHINRKHHIRSSKG